jgi:hypothetical protein
MRIAVCGTHSVGKSTFVNDFVAAHPDYTREEEPYRALRDFYPIKFGKESSRYDNGIQLYYSLSRVKQYTSPEDRVIHDRSPLDYIAYSLYTAHYRQTDIDRPFVEAMVEPVREALSFIDLLVFIPISRAHPMKLENDGIRPIETAYRTEVDRFFKQIFFDGVYGLFPDGPPAAMLEIQGSREARLDRIVEAMRAAAR